MTAAPRDAADLDAAVAAAEARVADLIAHHDRHIEALAAIQSELAQARADAERARGRWHLAAMRAMVGG